VQQARLILNKIEDSIYAVARTTPVPIGDGKVLMETTTRRESVSGPVVRQLMTEQFGAAAAEEACEYSSTKTAIDGVIRKVAKERGTKITELKDSFYSDLAKANGINAKHYTSIRVQKARKELAS
jgi:hypothetical protein